MLQDCAAVPFSFGNLPNISLCTDACECKSELVLIKVQNVLTQSITFLLHLSPSVIEDILITCSKAIYF